MMVDSTPTWQSPPSRMASTLPSISSSICLAVVGLGFPERLPDGAATGTPAALIMVLHIECAGHRIPTVYKPAVTTSGTTGLRRSIMVSGPGQNRFASFQAVSGISSQYRSSQDGSGMCKISGLSWGRPLA